MCVWRCVLEARRGVAWRAGRDRSQTLHWVCVCVSVCALQEKAFGLFTASIGLGLRKFRRYNRLGFGLAYVFIISVSTLNSPHVSHVLSTGLQTVELIINL